MTGDIRRLSDRKRRGGELSPEEIRWLVDAYTAGQIDDAPMAAWLMAVCCSGMTDDETWHLTEAMAHSGEMLDMSQIGLPTVDKHSTGGVGDKVTFIAGPLAAACGVSVPKMSGRGLGHTGGTIDKLEAIPGLCTDLSPDAIVSQARQIGLVIAAQTGDLAPADGKMYALRDATGTVDSRPLIASSIISKKLAAGAGAIVLEVTVGSGAFMETVEEARDLAALMTWLATRAGRSVATVLTGMDTPLGQAVGNAVEVEEAVRILRGDFRDAGPQCGVLEVSAAVAAQMILATGVEDTIDAAEEAVASALDSGEGFGKLLRMVEAQGGDASLLEAPMLGHQPAQVGHLRAERAGVVTRIDARGAGHAALEAGAGRKQAGESVDPAAGLRIVRPEGSQVDRGDTIVEVMAGSAGRLERALAELERAIVVAEHDAEDRPHVIDIIPPEESR